MPVTTETLCTHLDYTAWASRRLVDAASQLPAEELTRDFQTADRSILGTLVHVYAADRIWLGRIEGALPAEFMNPEKDMHLSILQHDWPALLARWKKYFSGVTDCKARIAYQDLQGNKYETPLWQIVLHVVNHATHHRGQAAGFMRTMGRTPPKLDLIYFYRER